MPMETFWSVVTALAVDVYAGGLADPSDILDRLTGQAPVDEAGDGPPDEATWGTSPTAQQQQRAMMDLMAGPSPGPGGPP